MIDMTNWKMKEHGVPDSQWTVLRYKGKSKWECQCTCGNVKSIDSYSLRKGGSKSCGKCGNKKNKTIDMSGWKMWEHGIPDSKIIVISQAPTQKDHALWHCKCNCGNPNTFIVDGTNLRTGHTLSCGCVREGKGHKDFSNQYINNIWVGEKIGQNKQGSYLYDCICFCGNHFISDTTRLLNGHKKSCGCLHSKGEYKIKQILDNLKIENFSYKQEYPLCDLLGPKKGYRRMDFAIFKNKELKCFIEYQGEQHYDNKNNWYSGEADTEKRKYCQKNNIPLIEISYLDYEKINENYILGLLKDII